MDAARPSPNRRIRRLLFHAPVQIEVSAPPEEVALRLERTLVSPGFGWMWSLETDTFFGRVRGDAFWLGWSPYSRYSFTSKLRGRVVRRGTGSEIVATFKRSAFVVGFLAFAGGFWVLWMGAVAAGTVLDLVRPTGSMVVDVEALAFGAAMGLALLGFVALLRWIDDLTQRKIMQFLDSLLAGSEGPAPAP